MSETKISSTGEGSRGGKSPLWMQDGKTLSKNLMYTPLVAYQKSAIGTSDSTKPCHPSEYMGNKKSVPTSLRESTLSSTLHFISCDYHRNRASVNDAKNNGIRPLGLSEMEDRIRQKAVTLVGGGINSTIPVTKTTKGSKKRRQRSWEQVEPILKKSSVENVLSGSEPGQAVAFLQKLNSAWNDYAWKLLTNNKDKNEVSEDDLNAIEVRLGALAKKQSSSKDDSGATRFHRAGDSKDDQIELIGAHLRIDASNAHSSWVGRFGVLIGETTNTYRVASYARRSKRKKSAKKVLRQKKKQRVQGQEQANMKLERSVERNGGDIGQGTEKSDESHTAATDHSNHNIIETLVLPKRGTVLQLILPLGLNKSISEHQELNSDGLTPSESMINIPENAIGISLVDQ